MSLNGQMLNKNKFYLSYELFHPVFEHRNYTFTSTYPLAPTPPKCYNNICMNDQIYSLKGASD